MIAVCMSNARFSFDWENKNFLKKKAWSSRTQLRYGNKPWEPEKYLPQVLMRVSFNYGLSASAGFVKVIY